MLIYKYLTPYSRATFSKNLNPKKIYLYSVEEDCQKVFHVDATDNFSVDTNKAQYCFTAKKINRQENALHIEEEDEIITLKQKKELLAIEGIEKLVFKYTPPKEADGSYTITLADDLEREDIIKTLYLNRLPQSKNIMIDHGERSEGCMLLRKENDLWISLPEKGAMAFVGAFSLTKIPFWELLPDENRTPLLTLVDAYIAMAGNSERNIVFSKFIDKFPR